MILILSRSGDLTTDYVIDWLNFYKYPFIRINSNDFKEKALKINLQKKWFLIDRQKIFIPDIHAAWYRKFKMKKIEPFQKSHIYIR
ncbi:hypothetical protein AGMMS50262_02870 [Bacteroidia bacterium]|nr:hypothetical protein AGMMS50262_02870 [Bacteroidia bacterium]